MARSRILTRCLSAIAILLILTSACSVAESPGLSSPSVPFVATPPDVVIEMLKLASITGNDLVYDLGSGDGRLAIAAATLFGARAVGVEIDAHLAEARDIRRLSQL